MTKYITVVGGRAFSVVGDTMTILEDGVWEAKKKRLDNRTLQQNRALHLWCQQIAEALNEKDLTVIRVLKADVSWSGTTVKEQIYKPILKAITDKDSTTKMDKKDIDIVYDTINRLLSDRFQIFVPFPSVDSMLFEQNHKDKQWH